MPAEEKGTPVQHPKRALLACLATSATFTPAMVTLFPCSATIAGVNCAGTLVTSGSGSLTATTNLGSGTYAMGVTMIGLTFALCAPNCRLTLAGQTLTDATWTNTARQLVIADDTYVWTAETCLFMKYGGATGTLNATYTQTDTPNMVVTGS